MTSTRIIDAYEAYLAIQTAAAPSGFVVKDGPQPDYADNENLVIVGCSSPREDQLYMFDQGDQEFEAIGTFGGVEKFMIPSCLLVATGDSQVSVFAGLRATAKTYFDALAHALYAPPRGVGDGQLNGAIGPTGWCWFSVLSGSPVSNSTGSGLFIPFNLTCETHFIS